MCSRVIRPASWWDIEMSAHKQRGFSLIELMVGLLISLLISVAAYAVFKGSAMAARRVIDTEATWHDAELSLLNMTQNIANAGYMMNLTAAGAPSPVQTANSVAWPDPNVSKPSEVLTVYSNINVTGNPVTAQVLSANVWDIALNPATGSPSLRLTIGATAPIYYADGVLVMRFRFSCSSAPSSYQTVCPGGVTDAKSVQVAMLVRGLSSDPNAQQTGTPVSAASYTFPDGTVYTVPAITACTGQVDCQAYRHQLFVTEVPLRNINWANNL